MNARIIKCKLELIFRSQFFHNLLHFSNHANDRSTTHLLGMTAKVCNSFRLTTSTLAFISSFTAAANFSPLYPPSTIQLVTSERFSFAWSIILIAPARSVTSAVVTAMAWGNPCVSTAIWRLMPDTFFPASYPLFCAVSVFLTLWASIMQKQVCSFRPYLMRTSPTNFF